LSKSNQKSFLAGLISNPTSFSILILSAVILIVWLDQRGSGNQTGGTAATLSAPIANTQMVPTLSAKSGQSDGLPPISLKGPSINPNDTPQILNTMGASETGDTAGKLQAPDLGGLLGGLEAKVKADPGNVGKRLLLAQTYNELGMADKALTELREMQKQDAENGRVNLILAQVLSSSDKEEDVKESLTLLDQLSKDKTVQQYLVHLYRGNALIRKQDHEGALKQWQESLKTMPEADNRRAMLEQSIGDLSMKGKTETSQ
jgi:predicted Zn-dependent protease